MIVWGGSDGGSRLATGGRYDSSADSWTATTTAGAPSQRSDHAAVWTGSRMIVWGGGDTVGLNSGGQYDPVGDSWTATTFFGAPSGRQAFSAVWTGTRMIVWGGQNVGSTGGQYGMLSLYVKN
jgi:hypothetical protein